jgi:hypothetical protein
MNTPENFINWLEGFLDACKNKPTAQQIKEIRKKISEISVDVKVMRHLSKGEIYTPLWNIQNGEVPADHFPTIGLVPPGSTEPNNGPLDEEFMAEIEKRKSATTMDELFD